MAVILVKQNWLNHFIETCTVNRNVICVINHTVAFRWTGVLYSNRWNSLNITTIIMSISDFLALFYISDGCGKWQICATKTQKILKLNKIRETFSDFVFVLFWTTLLFKDFMNIHVHWRWASCPIFPANQTRHIRFWTRGLYTVRVWLVSGFKKRTFRDRPAWTV